MIARIQALFDRFLRPADDGPEAAERAARCAAAALLLEMAAMDEQLSAVEHQAVVDAVRGGFGLSSEEADALLDCAEQERQEATDYYQFTALINAHFDAEARAALVEQLWQVAYADAHLGEYEEYLVRKVAGLLHVSHGTYIAAKLRAEGEAGLTPGEVPA